MQLSTPITLDSAVQPVNLPALSQSDLSAGTRITVSGWGTTSVNGDIFKNSLPRNLLFKMFLDTKNRREDLYQTFF